MAADLAPEEFRRALLRLKREGCSILVSSDDDVGTDRASRRTLGAVPSYSRVLVTGDEDGLGDRLPRGVTTDSDSVSVVNFRDVFAESSDPQTRADGLRDTVCDAVETFDKGGIGPGELRVSVDSVTEVAGEVGGDRTLDVTDAITDSVSGVCGMAYYHVDADDEETRASHASSCDAEVEVRTDGGTVYQRWHLPERGSTGWVHL
ncbi:hypothetical protein SAMN04487947_0684 [Halogeometricum rufum]|uniref:Halobacterial output domain-containing protein n=1 Tax=Halogeometricum rufum TaxID=553469 RepID=A0A1I6G7E2_9EURY|nr:hypothetical protein [Halogeometricum rufum]SFR38113.1 hypothetical protein SAMN04487947_0684 [Halogeometricum rufum]